MSPHYVDVPLATLPAGYRLALYRDRGEDGRDAVVWRHTAAGPGAAPGGPTASARATRIALFVPGNAGSRGQVRSLASESSRMVRALGSSPAAAASPEAPDPEAIDWFTLDFNEAWAAFSPHLLQLQAEALNQAIRFLIDDYAARRVARPPVGVAPTRPDADAHHHHHPNDNDNIIVVGHSMGGVVARLAPLLDSYPQHAVHVLVTLATPHRRPPIATSRGLLQIYDAIQRGWNDPAEAEGDASTRLAPVWGPDDTAMGAAATCDTMQFSTATTALMGAWTAADHLGIIWCHQV
ncbi:PGAP1-like protein, partial [Caulochytrium protostelioides]